MNLKGDLHIHSNFSDGKFSIQELVDKYSEKEYNVISITDHDTVEGCQEAINYGKTKNILVIPGIEISTKHNGEEVHILGYFNNEDYKKKEILDYSKEKKHSRYLRCKLIEKVLKENYNIYINSDIISLKTQGIIGRVHIAEEIVLNGYAKDTGEALEMYLNKGPANISNASLSVSEGIDLLRRNNATVVLAHPIVIKEKTLTYLLDNFSFDGLEAIYAINTEYDTDKFKKICKENNLLITGGSDFHYFNSYRHSDIGDISLDSFNINKLLEAIFKNK